MKAYVKRFGGSRMPHLVCTQCLGRLVECSCCFELFNVGDEIVCINGQHMCIKCALMRRIETEKEIEKEWIF